MFQANPKDKVVNDQSFETVLGALVKASGKLESEGNVKIEGVFKDGEINVKGLLYVAPGARIEAKIKAGVLEIYGEVKGNIEANQVKIGAEGKVYGDIDAGGNLVIESGGLFVGQSLLGKERTVKEEVTA